MDFEIGVKDLYAEAGTLDDKMTGDDIKPVKAIKKDAKNMKKAGKMGSGKMGGSVDMRDPLRTGGGSLK